MQKTKKRIAILGSTGSIGTRTLDVCRDLSAEFEVIALTARNNLRLLAKQAAEFNPKLIGLMDETKRATFLTKYHKPAVSCNVLVGLEGLTEIVTDDRVDIVVVATVGAIGLLPTIAAIKAKKQIALANKEVLVMAGEIVMSLAKKYRVPIIPIDSEHSAIFQCLSAGKPTEIEKIILTASGGPFRTLRADFKNITVKQALSHPTWAMGKKITIDSATLMNKGFEVIEATHLFNLPPDKIEVVIHPESIVHSMVEFVDKSIIAQMSITDMYLPIQFALTYPNRKPSPLLSLDLVKLGKLTFAQPDVRRFPCLRLAYDAVNIGGTMPAVLNAANEIAVSAFLEGKLAFSEIPKLIRQTMDSHQVIIHPTLNQILEVDTWARKQAQCKVLD
ncbi:MAG: 1-deoxy-D-xylulose-5-phosphate reductoisomerase [bacterium]|nr:1-deoxy-D-xylulose-5-phosphate reductoisomerase [bacterium]